MPSVPVATRPPAEPVTLLDVPAGSAFDTTIRNSAKDNLADDDESRIYQQVRGRLPLVNACYARERRIDPSLTGKLTLEVTVGPAPTGAVTDAAVIARSMNSSTVETCVVDTMKRLAFQRTGAEPITMRLPLVFR